MVRLVVPFRLGRTKDGKLVCEHAHDVDYLACGWVQKDRLVNRRLSGIIDPNQTSLGKLIVAPGLVRVTLQVVGKTRRH